jgi:hypothetical protein
MDGFCVVDDAKIEVFSLGRLPQCQSTVLFQIQVPPLSVHVSNESTDPVQLGSYPVSRFDLHVLGSRLACEHPMIENKIIVSKELVKMILSMRAFLNFEFNFTLKILTTFLTNSSNATAHPIIFIWNPILVIFKIGFSIILCNAFIALILGVKT